MKRNLFSVCCSRCKQETCSGKLLAVVESREVSVEKITKAKKKENTERMMYERQV